MTTRATGPGHNGGPPLDDERPVLRADWACARCAHWKPPSEREQSDYRMFQIGVTKRRVKEPSGICDRIMHRPGGPTAFGGTMGRSSCFNYEPAPPPPEPQDRRGFVTIWQGDRIVWKGIEGEEPAEFRQQELDL